MNTLVKILGAFMLLAFFVSCSSSGDNTSSTGIPDNNSVEFFGNWAAEKALFDIEFDDATERVDFIGEGGNIDLTVQENGKFSIDFIFGNDIETISGQMKHNNDLLSIVFDYSPNEKSYFEVQHSDTFLTINGGPLEYDFDRDGSTEPALVSFEFIPGLF